MVRLMKMTEIKDVYDMWLDKCQQLNIEFDAQYRESFYQMLEHSNVYVYLESGKIQSYMAVLGGYYLSSFYILSYSDAKILFDYIKDRYDEIQVDVYAKDPFNEYAYKLGLKKIGQEFNEELGYEEYQYEYLKD